MARNGSGTYVLPEAAFVPNTPISSAAVNSDFSDIADALTGSLARDGQGGMTAVLPLANTGFTYLTDPNTGMRRTAADAQAMTKGQGMIRVATKYSQIARAHFGARGIPVEIIQLSGSVELGPALGLADVIVDLVETGVTLRENGLTVVEEIAESTGRLVVNRASYQLKTNEVARLVNALAGALNGDQ